MKFQSITAFAAVFASAFAAPSPQYVGSPPTKPNRVTPVPIEGGYPRQAYLYKQVTLTNECGSDSCSVSKQDVESFTIGFNAGGSYGFVDGGFSVSKSHATGEGASCNGGNEGTGTQKVCLWARVAHTVYKVQPREHWDHEAAENGKAVGDPYWIWSPNDDRIGHGYVCAHNDECGSIGTEWWGYMSREDTLWTVESNKGGPQDFVWNEKEEDRWN